MIFAFLSETDCADFIQRLTVHYQTYTAVMSSLKNLYGRADTDEVLGKSRI